MSIRNELLEQIKTAILSGGAGGQFVKVRTEQYNQATPSLNTEIDSGFNLSVLDNNAELSFVVLVQVDATTNVYALFERVDALSINANKNIRIARSSEFEGAGGDVSMAFWVDSTTNTLHYEIDTDGSGKTVTNAIISTIEYVFQ